MVSPTCIAIGSSIRQNCAGWIREGLCPYLSHTLLCREFSTCQTPYLSRSSQRRHSLLVWINFTCRPSSMDMQKRKEKKMKSEHGRSGIRRIGNSSEFSLDSGSVISPGGWAKALALGFTATLLFSLGLYIGISGLVIVFLELVL